MTDIRSQRLSKFRRLLSREGLDAILIANYAPSASSLGFDYNLFYLAHLFRRYDNSFLILTDDDYYLCVDSLEVERAQKESWLEVGEAQILGLSSEEFAQLIMEALKERGSGLHPRLGVNGKRLYSSVGLALAKEAELVDLALVIEKARLVKDAMEIVLITRACQIAEAGAQAVISSIQEGMTELELAALAEYEMRKEGSEYFWWYRTLVSSGPNAVSFNGGMSPTDRAVKRGDLVHIDLCPSYRGYNADIARTMVMGPPTKKQVAVMDMTYSAFENAIGALKEGNRIRDVREATFRVVEGTEYEDLFMGPGHGMGINDDCYPFFDAKNADFVFQNGMFMSIEVATMVPGLGGVRYEDNFIVNGSTPTRLTRGEKLGIVGV